MLLAIAFLGAAPDDNRATSESNDSVTPTSKTDLLQRSTIGDEALNWRCVLRIWILMSHITPSRIIDGPREREYSTNIYRPLLLHLSPSRVEQRKFWHGFDSMIR